MSKEAFQPLPQNLNPTGTRCVQLNIPDDPDWIRNFWGVLINLTKWYTFARDDNHGGTVVAQRWRRILLNEQAQFWAGEDCIPIVKIIEEWTEEMSLCDNIRWNGSVLEVLCCGEWTPVPGADGGVISGPGVQPGGTSRPGPGQTNCYNVVLAANNIWQLPFPVLPGDLITLSNIAGAWSDGSVHWYCPDGTPYLLGNCVGAGGHDGGDPDATEFHMQLIAQISSNYYGLTTPLTVSGIGAQQLYFQANDGTLNDNAGSVAFQVCVESGSVAPVGTWCHTFDFTAGQDGWTVFDNCGVGCDCGEWAAGGFRQITGLCSDNVFVLSPYMASGAIIKRIVMEMSPGLASGVNPYVIVTDRDNNTLISDNFVGSIWDYDWTANVVAYPQINVGWDPNLGSSQALANQTVSITLYGTGIDPFGTSNC